MDYALGTLVPGHSDISNLGSGLIKLLRKVSLVNELIQGDILRTEQRRDQAPLSYNIIISRASVTAAPRLAEWADVERAAVRHGNETFKIRKRFTFHSF